MQNQLLKKTERSRIGYIDVFRGIGIILVVIGHVGFSLNSTIYIQSFHMPMFFFISGFLFSGNRPWRPFIIKRIRTLLVPYFAFGLVATAIVYFGKPSVFPAKLQAFLWYSTEEYPLSTAMWFLPALFIGNVVYYFLDKVKNPILRNGTIIALALFGEFFTMLTGIILPYALCPALVGVGLIHIGRLLRPYESKIVSLKPYVIIPMAIAGVLLSIYEGYVSMRTSTYPDAVLFWPVALINTIVALNAASFLERKFCQNPCSRYLSKIGQNAIVYVVLNQQCINIAGFAVQRLKLGFYLQQTLTFLLSMVLLYVCTEIVIRTPLRKLIGRD